MNEPTTTANPLTIFDDPEVRAAIDAFADSCRAFGRLIAEAISSAARIISSWWFTVKSTFGRLIAEAISSAERIISSWWFTVKSTVVPARWAHLARYARKKRTRVKYQRMISRRVAELLGAVMAT